MYVFIYLVCIFSCLILHLFLSHILIFSLLGDYVFKCVCTSHMLCVRLTCFLITGHLPTYVLTYLLYLPADVAVMLPTSRLVYADVGDVTS